MSVIGAMAGYRKKGFIDFCEKLWYDGLGSIKFLQGNETFLVTSGMAYEKCGEHMGD